MSSNSVIPSAEQLAAARLHQWHQNGEALLTFENLRSWINAAGLALFSPRAQQLPSPAPSMVEAVLGAPNATPSLSDTEQARSLLARLIAEGAALPLNLLGSPSGAGTETPDFIVSTAVFPYIFTLRGDKAWKQPPTTSGATKVSPLALNTYTLLLEKGSLSAYDLVTQLGKEVTEPAVLRALTELWQHLRVLPIPQPDGAATLWELTSTRYTKQLKAGANAGQPTALSALITLYLGQAIVATEEEIETFLSPIAARSRIRDVVHALVGARQLETIAVEGKTVLHVNGDLPAFLAAPAARPVEGEATEAAATTEGAEPADAAADSEPRIKKFIPAPRKVGTGYVNKFGRKPEGGPASPRERRPFTRESNRPDRPSFTKPWAEEQADRLAAAARASSVPSSDTEGGADAGAQEAPRTYTKPSYDRGSKPSYDRGSRPSYDRGNKPAFGRKPAFGARPAFGDRPASGDRPRFGGKPSFGDKPRYGADRGSDRGSDRGGFSSRPSFRRDDDSRPPRREFTPRPAGDFNRTPGDFAPRKTFSKPGTFGRKREGGFAGKPSFGRDNESRPPRRDFGDSRPPRRDFTPRPSGEGFGGSSSDRGSSYPARKPFVPREGAAGETTGPRYRKFDAPRTPRPFNADRPARPYSSDRPARPYSSDRPTGSGFSGKPSYGGKPSFGSKPSFGPRKPFGSSEGGYAGKSSSGFAGKKPYDKTGGGFAGKKPYGKFAAGTGKPASTFDKFKGNKKPFGNRPPARKYRPDEGASAE